MGHRRNEYKNSLKKFRGKVRQCYAAETARRTKPNIRHRFSIKQSFSFLVRTPLKTTFQMNISVLNENPNLDLSYWPSPDSVPLKNWSSIANEFQVKIPSEITFLLMIFCASIKTILHSKPKMFFKACFSKAVLAPQFHSSFFSLFPFKYSPIGRVDFEMWSFS